MHGPKLALTAYICIQISVCTASKVSYRQLITILKLFFTTSFKSRVKGMQWCSVCNPTLFMQQRAGFLALQEVSGIQTVLFSGLAFLGRFLCRILNVNAHELPKSFDSTTQCCQGTLLFLNSFTTSSGSKDAMCALHNIKQLFSSSFMNLVQVQDINFISIHSLSQTELKTKRFFHEKKLRALYFLDIFIFLW